MSKDKNTSNLSATKNTENQFQNVGREVDKKDLSKKIKLTNSLTTDYYNTFR